MKTYIVVALVSIIIATARQGLFLPCPYYARIEDIPIARRPYPSPLTGVFAPNAILSGSEKYFRGAKHSETVAVSKEGIAYLPVESGDILASSLANPGSLSLLARVGGRPIGVTLHPDGYLLVCDAIKGLLAVDIPSGTVRLLTNRVTEGDLPQGEADIAFADDAVVASDGRIFFSDATAIAAPRRPDGSYDMLMASKATFFAGRPSGRVLVYDPRDRSTRVVASGIWFANGVSLSRDESFLVIAETFGCRLLRHWLKGERAGTTEVFLDSLPGFVDGVSASPDGSSFWAAIFTLPQKSVLAIAWAPGPISKLLRWAVAMLPPQLQPQVQPYGLVVQVAANGTALRSMHDPTGKTCRSISSANHIGDKLLLGNLGTSWVCALDLAALGA